MKEDVINSNKPVRPTPGGRPLDAGTDRGVKSSPVTNPALEEHQILMTRGELIFSLRDVHRYWSTPRISPHEIEELEQQNLIERSPIGLSAIRLTEHGSRIKRLQPLQAR